MRSNFIYKIMNRLILIVVKSMSLYLMDWKNIDYNSVEGKTLLIVRHGGIGDLLVISAIFRKINIEHPGMKLLLMTQGKYHSLFKELKYLHDVCDFSINGIFTILKSDYILFLDNSIEHDDDAKRQNIYDLLSIKYSGINLENNEKCPIVHIDENSNSYLLEKMPFLSKSVKKVGVQLLAASPTRTPSLAFWKDVIDIILEKYSDCIVILICDSKYQNIAEEVLCFFSEKKVFNFGLYSRNINDLVSLITFLDFVVCPDSSVVHLAAALNVPSLSIYGPFPSELRTKYYIQNDSIDAVRFCAPCFTHGHKPCAFSIDKISPCFDNISTSTLDYYISRKYKSIIYKKYISDLMVSRDYVEEECYIIGKGPSLDLYDMERLNGKLTICINDSFKLVNNPNFIFYHDAVFKDDFEESNLPKTQWILPVFLNKPDKTKIRCTHYLDSFTNKDIYLYYKKHVDTFSSDLNNSLFLDNILLSKSGTIQSAIHFAYCLGVKKINFIGVDGGINGGKYYSKYFNSKINEFSNMDMYEIIKKESIDLLKILRIDYHFVGEEK